MPDTEPTHQREHPHAADRDFPPRARRLLIIGLDGATFDVLGPLMDRGRMPNLRRLIDGGTAGVLRSTTPPITPAAWTTFMTGKSPGTHGIIDFERYDVRTNKLSFNTTSAVRHVRTLWRILGDKGLKVGSVNVPMTYPPVPVNGFLISGFEAVSTRGEFTFPPELKDEILRRWPDYSFKNKWNRSTLRRHETFAENLAQITDSFSTGADVVEFCGDKYGWDALMIVYKLVDNLQHKAWRYLDPRTRDRFGRRAQMTEDCFSELDQAVGRLMRYAERHDAHVFVMSDHGHGSLDGKVQPNLMLRQWGYLNLRKHGAQANTRAHKIVGRPLGKKGRFAAGNFSLEHDLAVDFSRTRAAVMHAGMNGFLYINLAGRQQTGIVEPGEYEHLRDELKNRLENVTCPDRDGETIKVFDAVHKPEELYGCDRANREWLPDLLLVPRRGLSVVRKIRGRRFVKWVPVGRMEGTHRPEGIWAVSGSGVAASKTVDTDIINATPTILAMMGVRVPDDMEGEVIEAAFNPPLEWGTQEASPTQATDEPHSQDQAYSPEEMAQLTERLADLGYLE